MMHGSIGICAGTNAVCYHNILTTMVVIRNKSKSLSQILWIQETKVLIYKFTVTSLVLDIF